MDSSTAERLQDSHSNKETVESNQIGTNVSFKIDYSILKVCWIYTSYFISMRFISLAMNCRCFDKGIEKLT